AGWIRLANWYGTGSGSDLALCRRRLPSPPGRYRSLYRTNSPTVSGCLDFCVFGERAWRRKRSAGSVRLKSRLVNARARTNAAVPKAHDMTLKKASYTTKPQAQHMMFNRAKEDEHHGRRRNRLESAWIYLLWNMVTGIGGVRRQDFCHYSNIR